MDRLRIRIRWVPLFTIWFVLKHKSTQLFNYKFLIIGRLSTQIWSRPSIKWRLRCILPWPNLSFKPPPTFAQCWDTDRLTLFENTSVNMELNRITTRSAAAMIAEYLCFRYLLPEFVSMFTNLFRTYVFPRPLLVQPIWAVWFDR